MVQVHNAPIMLIAGQAVDDHSVAIAYGPLQHHAIHLRHALLQALHRRVIRADGRELMQLRLASVAVHCNA